MIRAGVCIAVELVVALVLVLAVGISAAHTFAALLAAIALTLLVLAQREESVPQWPRLEVDSRDGARDDITALSWSFMARDNTVSVRAVHAFRNAASVRLRLLGVDLSDPEQEPAARLLLGDEAYDLAMARNPKPTMAQLGRSIDALAAIDPADTPARTLDSGTGSAASPNQPTDISSTDISSTEPQSTRTPL